MLVAPLKHPVLFVFSLGFALVTCLASFYAATEIVGLDVSSFAELLPVALAALGVDALVAVGGALGGAGRRFLLATAGLGVRVWLVKSLLAASWGSAVLVWLAAAGIGLLVLLVLIAVAAALAAAAGVDPQEMLQN